MEKWIGPPPSPGYPSLSPLSPLSLPSPRYPPPIRGGRGGEGRGGEGRGGEGKGGEGGGKDPGSGSGIRYCILNIIIDEAGNAS
jgi:hypothetical protein